MNEENQVYFVDSDQLPPAALERKHRLEQDPSFRTNHMEYMKGMQIIGSDIKEKVLKAMDAYDYDVYTAADVERALRSRILKLFSLLQQHHIWSRWREKRRRSRKIILEIRYIFLHHSTSPIIVRTTAFTVDLTVTTTSAARN